jgi:hypothetical protein
MSLKKILNDKIQQAGQLSVEEIEIISKDNGYKISNAERRLRESPNVLALKNDRGYIKAYAWIGEQITRPQIYEDRRLSLNL